MKIGVKKIQKFLSECKFDPNKPGPLKVILEANNPDYYETRAVELIREAKNNNNIYDYIDRIQKAIQLLTLAALLRQVQ